MTARRTGGDRPDPALDTTRAAKGSVQEAIGTLLGDDDVRARGTAEKKAAAAAPPGKRPSPKASPPR